jgi:hypothetical protein
VKGDKVIGGEKEDEEELLEEELLKDIEGVQLAPGKACCIRLDEEEELDEEGLGEREELEGEEVDGDGEGVQLGPEEDCCFGRSAGKL